MAADEQGNEVLHAELLKFNAFLELEANQERADRALKQAAKRRDGAATALRELREDPNASKEAKEEAEAAWKAAVEAERTLADGGTGEPVDQDARAQAPDEAEESEPPVEQAGAAPVEEPVEAPVEAPVAREDLTEPERGDFGEGAETASSETSSGEEPSPEEGGDPEEPQPAPQPTG